MRKKSGGTRKMKIRSRSQSATGKTKRSARRNQRKIAAAREGKQVQIDQQHDMMYDAGYNRGYNKGYDDGYNLAVKLGKEEGTAEYTLGYDKGFKKGLYEGGDGIVDELLPHDLILPDYTIQDIIAHGIIQLESTALPLLDAEQVKAKICLALEQRTPLSVVRVGDGELLTMSQDLVFSTEEVRKKGDFLEYAGVAIPDLDARNDLARSVREATIVGIPKLRLPNFLPLLNPVFQAHGLDYRKMKLTLSTVNYELYMNGHLPEILRNRRILVIGKRAEELSAYLRERGYETAPPITEVTGVKDVAKVIRDAATRDYDIALVSAGIPAVMISQRLASNQGKVAFDFGHLADSLLKGEASL